MTPPIRRALPSWSGLDQSLGLSAPMIFITGPRQVGKTFLARATSAPYYNWDTIEVKKAFLKDPYFFRSDSSLVVFDEIHKRRDWKKLLKGYYDSPSRAENFIVTGSGRFDQFQRGGDSLQGRYHSFQLWPLTVDELALSDKLSPPRTWATWEPNTDFDDSDLLTLGGFPSPFLSGKQAVTNRWGDQYIDRLIREDVRDFSQVQRIDQMELLARILPHRVASPLSLNGLAEDIEVSPVAIKSWLRLFEMLFLGIRVAPYHRKIHRAVKREVKWYFLPWTLVEDLGARFENYLAIQLSATCSAWSEQGYGRWELFYLRDQDRREVDFLICRDLIPQALIEAKASEQRFTTALSYYCRKLRLPGFLVYPKGATRREELGWSLPSGRFLSGLISTS